MKRAVLLAALAGAPALAVACAPDDGAGPDPASRASLASLAHDSLPSHEPTGDGWRRAVDWTPTAIPVNAWTYAPDNGSRLRNYAAPEWWERGHELHTLVEGPDSSRALRALFPEGMWGIELPYPQDIDHTMYAMPVPEGATRLDVRFTTPTPDSAYEARLLPTWSGWGDVDWSTLEARTDGFSVQVRTPAPAGGGTALVAAGWRSQGPSAIYGEALSVDSLPQRGDVYVSLVVRTSPGFSVVGRDSLSLSGQKLGFLLANNLTETPYAVIDPGILGIGKRSVLAEEGLFFTYTNQYDDRRGDRHFWNVEDQLIRLDDGAWHRLELLIEGVQPGVAGATATMWVDGQQVAQETGLIVFGAATTQPRWDGVGISNPYGGGFARVPRDQWIDYAQVRMSVR
jgi:hypothetical protein